ncbi:hypothetical protein [Daejeonella sp.]|uniref:hypothetical protein n=1 Tax=Daejeonella sp. TaxID=2805397 RepID=UPI00271E05B3|nr:hypothetical protein [Daejeonella sp.]MDO8993386.1 hypothetical protein [Daejeonella sp.]MDP2413970.1 hypothetical protein [Daejeonella sp.]
MNKIKIGLIVFLAVVALSCRTDAPDFRGIAELVKTKHSGHKVLIVGHSNTLLELLEAFGVSRPLAALSDDDYDFFFELRIDPKGKGELKTLHYGKTHRSSIMK